MRTLTVVRLTLWLVLSWAVAAGAQSAGKSQKLWGAQWITAPGVPQRDEAVLHFRKVIELGAAPQRFLVDVSADNQFIFFVNQQRVGSGPSRSDLAHWRYETYDLAAFLHPGRNVLAATVWNFGTHAALAQMSDRVALLLHGEGQAEAVADTDSSWEVEQEKGIETLPPAVHGYYAAEPGERLDAAAFDWSWSANPEKKWVPAVVLSQASLREDTDSHNNWQLVRDPLPVMEMKAEAAGRVVRAAGIGLPSGFPDNEVTIPAHAKASLLLDNAQLTTAYPELTVSGGRGSKVRLTYAEALADSRGEKGNRSQIEGKQISGPVDEFLPDGKGREFVPLAWRTWRYLQLDVETADEPLTLRRLRAWFTAYPFAERARFHSDDSSLTPIWDIGWRTARLDAHDTYMDTPYWERLQYVGDTRIQALISYAVAGDDRLARQAIEAFNTSRIPDGITQSRYPSSLEQIIPTFSLLWIGMVHDFWLYRGDLEFVKAQLPGTRTVLDWFLGKQRPDGLMGKLPWWPFLDWGKDFEFGMPPQDENGGSAPITLQFVEALRYAAEMEAAMGDPHQAEIYRTAAKRASDAVRQQCWSAQNGLLADTPAKQHYSQHANILGVWLDVVPPAQQRGVLTKILSTSDPAFTASAPVPAM
ncbi:MAG TPA: hypothetical protein VFB00_08425, partial [Terriglobales bacterium]|nr:hypothetical protein [Terriglobales bacterium]